MSTENKLTVLVTGGAEGIGASISERLSKDGYTVIIGARHQQAGEEKANKIGGEYLYLDVTDPANVESVIQHIVKKYGKLDALVNNAGILAPGPALADQTIEDWKRVLDVNLNGVFYGMKYALAQMAQQESGGNIVNIGSMNGFRGLANMGAYVPSKWALRGLTAMAAVEYSQQNIRVNSVAPSTTRSKMVDEWVSNQPDPELAVEQATAMHAIPKMVEPEDIAAATAFLLSDESRFITGTTLPVDAGTLARMPNAKV